jgi:YebC/PmpR family DNA-binding regulatory protein
MSGHSHYATIHRQKEANDAQKGKAFSKIAREIAIAVRLGGGPDPDSNSKLRVAMEHARGVNMPKDNVERAITKASSTAENLEQVIYEGFGPSGVGIMIDTTTDNRNRTGQEIKNILERSGGNMAGPGSVSFNFEPRGLIVLKKDADVQEQMLKLIDAGVDDLDETPDGVEVYVLPDKLSLVRTDLESKGFTVLSAEIIQRPKNFMIIEDEGVATRLLNLLDKLEEHDDVQGVYANLDIPEEILKKFSTN